MNKEFYGVYNNTTAEDVLRAKTMEELSKGKCFFHNSEDLSGRHYVIVGGSKEVAREVEMTATLGAKDIKKVTILGGFLPVSKKYYQKLNTKLSIILIGDWIAGIIVTTAIISLFCWLTWKYSFTEEFGIGSAFLPVGSFVGLLWVRIGQIIKTKAVNEASRLAVNPSESMKNYGIPNYKDRQIPALICSDNIAEAVSKYRQKEKKA